MQTHNAVGVFLGILEVVEINAGRMNEMSNVEITAVLSTAA